MIDRKDWVWYGHAAHFCAADSCRVHLATRVGVVIVSTVGAYYPPDIATLVQANTAMGRQPPGFSLDEELADIERTKRAGVQLGLERENGMHQIGYGRFYETMSFEAGPACAREGCGGIPEIGVELDGYGAYQTALEAQLGHVEICERFATDEGQAEAIAEIARRKAERAAEEKQSS